MIDWLRVSHRFAISSKLGEGENGPPVRDGCATQPSIVRLAIKVPAPPKPTAASSRVLALSRAIKMQRKGAPPSLGYFQFRSDLLNETLHLLIESNVGFLYRASSALLSTSSPLNGTYHHLPLLT